MRRTIKRMGVAAKAAWLTVKRLRRQWTNTHTEGPTGSALAAERVAEASRNYREGLDRAFASIAENEFEKESRWHDLLMYGQQTELQVTGDSMLHAGDDVTIEFPGGHVLHAKVTRHIDDGDTIRALLMPINVNMGPL